MSSGDLASPASSDPAAGVSPVSGSPSGAEGFVPLGARRMFGLKDAVTSVNVLSGVVGIWFCIRGDRLAASYSFLVGYAADCVDGLVARATRGGNRFGSEYDTAADFVAQAIAPAFIVYLAYRDASAALGVSPRVADGLGLFLACLLVLVASVRQARNTVRPVSVDFAWIGLPRSVASFILLGFANSILFIQAPGGMWLGVVLVGLVAFFELTNLPFMSHHGRKQMLGAKILLIGFLTTTPLTFLVAPRWGWDVLFFWTFGYACGSWTVMTREERARVKQAVAEADRVLRDAETRRWHEAEARKRAAAITR